MALTPEELQSAQDAARELAEELGVAEDKVDKLVEGWVKATAETKRSIEQYQEIVANASSILESQEAQMELKKQEIELQKLLGELTEVEAQKQIESIERLKNKARSFDDMVGGLLGINSKMQTFVNFLTDGGESAEALSMSIARTVTPTNILLSVVSKVVEQTVALLLATDEALVSFNKATGASSLYAEELKAVERELRMQGVTIDSAAESFGALVTNVTDLNQLAPSTRADLVNTTALLEKYGVAADTTAANLQSMTKTMGMSAQQAAATSRQIFTFAKSIGAAPAEMAESFKSAAPILAKFGDEAPEIFMETAYAAREAGMSLDQLLSITEKFDTFDGAAESVGKLNAILGGPFLNSLEMVKATSPVERMRMLSDAVGAAGASFEEMGYYQKITLTEALGLKDVGELAMLMAGEFDGLGDSMANLSQSELIELKKQSADFNTIMDEMTQIMKMFVVDFLPPVIETLKFLMDQFQNLNDMTGGMLPKLILFGLAIFALSKFGVILTAVFSGFGSIFAGLITQLSAMIPVIGGTGSVSAAATPYVLALGAAMLLMGGAIYLAASGFSMLVDSMTELFKVASPEQMLAFGASLVGIAVGMYALSAAAPVLPAVLVLLTAISVALLGISYAFSMLDFSNLEPLGNIFMGLGQIVSGETSNLKEAMDSVAKLTTAISSIDDEKKVVAVQQLIESIRGNTTAGTTAAVATTGAGAVGPGGGKVVHINLTIGKRQLQPVVGEIIGDMFRII
jgi:hypothetical protein